MRRAEQARKEREALEKKKRDLNNKACTDLVNGQKYAQELAEIYQAEHIKAGDVVSLKKPTPHTEVRADGKADMWAVAWDDIGSGLSNVFGAEAINKTRVGLICESHWFPIEVKSGGYETLEHSKVGDASKPVSVYAVGTNDNYLDSTVGLKFNFGKSYSLDLHLGFNDIGINSTVKYDNKIDNLNLFVSLGNLGVGVEKSVTGTNDNNNNTDTQYTKFSVGGAPLVYTAAAWYLKKYGIEIPMPNMNPWSMPAPAH